MSTTRKIEGFANLTDNDEITLSIEPNTSPIHIYKEPATLVIGGKAFTEEEVIAIIGDLYSAAMDGPYFPNTKRMDEYLAKHGIKLP